jgi:hypothetical protein
MKSSFIRSFNLRVTITISIEAEDFLEAAEHQKRLEESMTPLLEAYPSASVSVSRGRGVRGEALSPIRTARVHSGNVRRYG